MSPTKLYGLKCHLKGIWLMNVVKIIIIYEYMTIERMNIWSRFFIGHELCDPWIKKKVTVQMRELILIIWLSKKHSKIIYIQSEDGIIMHNQSEEIINCKHVIHPGVTTTSSLWRLFYKKRGKLLPGRHMRRNTFDAVTWPSKCDDYLW